jgi:hypothetical protein
MQGYGEPPLSEEDRRDLEVRLKGPIAVAKDAMTTVRCTNVPRATIEVAQATALGVVAAMSAIENARSK